MQILRTEDELELAETLEDSNGNEYRFYWVKNQLFCSTDTNTLAKVSPSRIPAVEELDDQDGELQLMETTVASLAKYGLTK
jgi:hypothetical protein